MICSWFQKNSLKIHHLYLISREFPDNQLLEHLHGYKLTCYTCPSCLKFQMISVGFGGSPGESSVISFFFDKCIVIKTDKCITLKVWYVCSFFSMCVFFVLNLASRFQVKSVGGKNSAILTFASRRRQTLGAYTVGPRIPSRSCRVSALPSSSGIHRVNRNDSHHGCESFVSYRVTEKRRRLHSVWMCSDHHPGTTSFEYR